MTPREYAQKLEKQLNTLLTSNRPFALGVTAAHTMMTERIFTKGQSTSDGQIGKYSDKGIYLKRYSDPVGKRAKKKYGIAERNGNGLDPKKGKFGQTEFADGSKHITSYFQGWKEFRQVQGVESNYVNLNYVGDLKSDFERPAKKIDVNLYEVDLSRDLNNKKAKGNEEHFGKIIFVPSKEEIKELLRVTENELKLLFQ